MGVFNYYYLTSFISVLKPCSIFFNNDCFREFLSSFSYFSPTVQWSHNKLKVQCYGYIIGYSGDKCKR